jgi:hypothetical protein
MTDCKGVGPESAATDPGAQKNVGSGKSRSSKPQPSDPQAAPKSWRDHIEAVAIELSDAADGGAA